MKKLFSILKNREPLEKIFFAGVFFAILFYAYNYFTRLNTAYVCFDQSKKPYLLFFFHPTQKLKGENNDWVKDGISNYDQDEWTYNFDKKLNKITHYREARYSFKKNYSYFEYLSKKGEKRSLRINTYRTEVFDIKKEIFKIYEYENIRQLTEKFLINNDEDLGFEILMKIKKEFKCEEDKDLYKRIANIKIEDLAK